MFHSQAVAQFCLPARLVGSLSVCLEDQDCQPRPSLTGAAADGAANVDAPAVVVLPAICARPESDDASERLIRMRLADKPLILFIGHPAVLYRSSAFQRPGVNFGWLFSNRRTLEGLASVARRSFCT